MAARYTTEMVEDSLRETQFQVILDAVERHGLGGEALTASDIHELVRAEAVGLASAHEVATVLGQHDDDPRLAVEEGSPYRYRFSNL